MSQVYEEQLVKPHPDDDMIEEILESEVEEEVFVPDVDEPTDLSESSLSHYMQQIASSTPLSKEEEQELGYSIKQGDKEALAKLVNANLKFVISVAYKFKNSGLPLLDIISQGNLGLMEAAIRYDPTRGVKFISYAVWWIRQYIVQGIAEQSGTVRLPIKQVGNLFKIKSAQ
jgi:RNA polymerase primary sigma factor